MSAWVDENGSGQQDPSEPSLEGVQFQVNDTYNGYKSVGGKAISDWNGHARVSVWLPGCPAARFEVLAIPPVGYRAQTDAPVQVAGRGYGSEEPLAFGFVRIEGFPPPTPYIPRLTCTLYSQSASDISTAPDGTVWIVSESGAARYNAQSDTWQSFPAAPGVPALFDRIQVGPQETVWISARDFAAARLHNGAWTYYTGEKNLIASSEPSIGTTPDGFIWFAPASPPNSLVAFNPATSTWKAFFADTEYGTDSARLFTDGVVWRAAFGYASKYDMPSSLPSGWKVYDRHVFSADETKQLPTVRGWIEAAVIDDQATLWLAHSFGVSRFDPKTGTAQLYDNSSTHNVVSEPPEDVAVAPEGSVWVASGREHALAFMLPAPSAEWQRFDPRDGIPDEEQIDSVEVDREGQVWFGFRTKSTLARCAKRTP